MEVIVGSPVFRVAARRVVPRGRAGIEMKSLTEILYLLLRRWKTLCRRTCQLAEPCRGGGCREARLGWRLIFCTLEISLLVLSQQQ